MANRTDWADEAVRGIISAKERERARRELLDHMEDHMESLMAAGFSAEDAEKQAVFAMGAPEITAKLLRKTHQPVLTRVLQVCKVLSLLLVLLLFVCFCRWGKGGLADLLPPAAVSYEDRIPKLADDPSLDVPADWTRRLYVLEKPVKALCGDYTFMVERAAWLTQDNGGSAELYLLLLCDYNAPFVPVPAFTGETRITDDLGRTFLSRDSTAIPTDDGWMTFSDTMLARASRSYPVQVNCKTATGTPPQWVRLDYTMEDLCFTMEIPLTGEVRP